MSILFSCLLVNIVLSCSPVDPTSWYVDDVLLLPDDPNIILLKMDHPKKDEKCKEYNVNEKELLSEKNCNSNTVSYYNGDMDTTQTDVPLIESYGNNTRMVITRNNDTFNITVPVNTSSAEYLIYTAFTLASKLATIAVISTDFMTGTPVVVVLEFESLMNNNYQIYLPNSMGMR